jgi:hypothetical protein
MAARRRKRSRCRHAYCSVRAHPALERLSRMGMGNQRYRTRSSPHQALWFRDSSKRSHPPSLQKVEGNVTFHTAMSTEFPQPAPGAAPSPRRLKKPSSPLRTMDESWVKKTFDGARPNEHRVQPLTLARTDSPTNITWTIKTTLTPMPMACQKLRIWTITCSAMMSNQGSAIVIKTLGHLSLGHLSI